ncbi:translocase of the inner membrane [Entomortierella lignicola]|nr:translocase of the inner membrane [Entomortierella lignicola]KAF9200790.1 translocase of the inner membrane [Haplosporangium sp. Z 27]
MPRSSDHSRDPCPYVIISDMGVSFTMGAVGGGVWHGVKGAKNSPRGERILGAVSAIKARAPTFGGGFAVWGGLYSTFECGMKGIRQKEDPWNSIASGFLTGGAVAVRGGPKVIVTSAAIGGIFMAVIEGLGIVFSRSFADQTRPVVPNIPDIAPPASQ